MSQMIKEQFPEVNGKSMAGINFMLPEDLKYDLNLLIISCYPWQQAIKDIWARNAAAISDRYEEFDICECHILPAQLSQCESDLRHEREHGIHSYLERQKKISV